ncbi:restriction endonuclease subunit S [Providencia vermicola]|uniref:restriction endonuclease subunit S n=1 Tax=Providencia vermicola TaxID=333965 RepID=UPI0034E51027
MVPKGWEVTTLGEHVTISSGYSPSKYVLAESGSFPFVKVEDMNNCAKYQSISRTYTETNGSPISKGAVIFPKRGAAIMNNKVRITDVEMYLDTNMMALTPKKSVFSEYLYYTLIKEELHKIADTSTIPQINNKHILPYRFKLPPLPEQRKIAKILSTWDKAIATTEKLIATSQQQKKALMQQLLTGKKRLVNPDTGKVFEGDWEEVKVNQIANITMGSSPKSESYNEVGIGLPLLQGNADIKARKSAPRIYTSQITKECNVNDILLSVRAPVGTVAKSLHNACIGRGIASIQAKKNIVQEFVYQWLLAFEPKWERFSQGSTFEAVNSNDIKTLHISLPVFQEQQKIASVLTAADKEIEFLEAKLAHLKEEKKALMQQLLTGKRRVKVSETEAA